LAGKAQDVECKGPSRVGNREAGGSYRKRRGEKVPSAQVNGEGRSLRRVLDPDRTPYTLVLVFHEEAVNHHLVRRTLEGFLVTGR
jgi:hypothetical protein